MDVVDDSGHEHRDHPQLEDDVPLHSVSLQITHSLHQLLKLMPRHHSLSEGSQDVRRHLESFRAGQPRGVNQLPVAVEAEPHLIFTVRPGNA